MLYLLIVSFVWALSFGLIKNQLAGLNPTAVAVVRLALAAIIFVPLLRPRAAPARDLAKFLVIGAIQFGAMYVLYLRAFLYIKSWEVAVFTITTPIYLIWIDALWRRRFEWAHWLAAALSVAGTLVIVWRGDQDAAAPNLWLGFGLIQLSNICFAVGQLAYRAARQSAKVPDHAIFGWLYLGAVALAASVSLVSSSWIGFRPTLSQWGVLAYLGILASGICFFLWNRGATQVNAGTLAAMNNAKIPLGVACSLWIFGEKANLTHLLVGGGLLAVSVILAERVRARS